MARNTHNLSFAIFALIIIFCFNPCAYSAPEKNDTKKIAVMNFDNRSSTGQWRTEVFLDGKKMGEKYLTVLP